MLVLKCVILFLFYACCILNWNPTAVWHCWFCWRVLFVFSYLLSKLISSTLLSCSSFSICVIYCPSLNFVNILMEMKESEFKLLVNYVTRRHHSKTRGRNTENTIVLLNKHFNCKIHIILTYNSKSKITIILYKKLHYFLYNFKLIYSEIQIQIIIMSLLSCHQYKLLSLCLLFSEDLFKICPLFCC